jgi:hypothetical protein
VSEFDYDPGAYDPGFDEGITSADLAAVAESAGAAGAARVMSEVVQAQQQQTQFDIDRQAATTLAEAERALRAFDPNWDSLKGYAAQTLAAHPSLLQPEALYDPEIAASNLWHAAEAGIGIENAQRAQAKAADDAQAFSRIKAAHDKSWSARMQESGKTIHDVLAEDS